MNRNVMPGGWSTTYSNTFQKVGFDTVSLSAIAMRPLNTGAGVLH